MSVLGFGKMSTAILKCPSGRFTIVGSVPAELTEPDPRSLSPGGRKVKVWATEQEAIDALLAIGCTRFQLADCSWYGALPGQTSLLRICPTCDAGDPTSVIPFEDCECKP